MSETEKAVVTHSIEYSPVSWKVVLEGRKKSGQGTNKQYVVNLFRQFFHVTSLLYVLA